LPQLGRFEAPIAGPAPYAHQIEILAAGVRRRYCVAATTIHAMIADPTTPETISILVDRSSRLTRQTM
jgi:hypothetical protein